MRRHRLSFFLPAPPVSLAWGNAICELVAPGSLRGSPGMTAPDPETCRGRAASGQSGAKPATAFMGAARREPTCRTCPEKAGAVRGRETQDQEQGRAGL